MSTSDVSNSKPPILAIAAPVRGEAPYLLEWIAYHRALGIKAFLLADNAGDDEETSKLLQTLHERRIIFRFDWRDQTRFQLKFYRQALGAARLFADGLFLIDVDEFLRPEAGRSVSQIAQKWLSDPSLGAVGLNWAIYGSSDRVQAGEGLVIERFTRRALQDFVVNRHTKTFVRVASCAGPSGNPHAMSLLSGRYTDPRGDDIVWDTTRRDPVGISTKVIWDVLRVDHFAVKSHEEFLAKQARGNLIQPERNWGTYFAVHDRNDVEDPIPSELVHRTKGEIGLLKSLTQSCANEWSPASPQQKARVMLRRPVVSDLIIDVGMSEGNDSEFYLQKGFRVVGIEADPIVYAQLCKRIR